MAFVFNKQFHFKSVLFLFWQSILRFCCFYGSLWDVYLLSNILTKTCRGKVVKEKLKFVKTGISLFILHSSSSHSLGFSPSYLTFDRAKGYVSCDET